MKTGHMTKMASLNPINLRRGSTTMGRLPPILFMTKTKRATTMACTEEGVSSVSTVKRMANQVSATRKTKVIKVIKIKLRLTYKRHSKREA